MKLSRHQALKLASTAGSIALLPTTALAQAPAKRTLILDSSDLQLGIHVPAVAGYAEILPTFPGYTAPKVLHIDLMNVQVANLVSGAADLSTGGPSNILAANEQGADLKMIGLYYRNTSLVFVVNSDKIKTFKDLEQPDVTIAVNSKGDSSEVLLVGPLVKNGIDINKLNVVSVGGSGERMRAMIAGRVQAVPLQADQVPAVEKQGPFKVLVRPQDYYKVYVNEVFVTQASWLKKPENVRAAVDFLKAVTLAFRRANRDFNWYLDMYRKHSSLPNASTITEAALRPLWTELVTQIKAWPDDPVLLPSDLNELIGPFKALGDIKATPNLNQMVDPSFAQQAVKELGRQGL